MHAMYTTFSCPSRQEWLALRRRYICASDAPAVMGYSRYRTPLEMFLEKTGAMPPQEETEAMYWGHRLEQVVLDEYCQRSNIRVQTPGALLVSTRHPWMAMTPDGLASDRVVQVKTARTTSGWGEAGTNRIPNDYYIQVQHEMIVTGLPRADMPVLFAGSHFRIYTIEADEEMQQEIIAAAAEFWRRIRENDPPPPTSSSDALRRWPCSTARCVVASGEALAAARNLAEVRLMQRWLATYRQRLELRLKSCLEDADTLVDPEGRLVATWRSTAPVRAIDVQRLRSEQPELAASYEIERSSHRRFLLCDNQQDEGDAPEDAPDRDEDRGPGADP